MSLSDKDLDDLYQQAKDQIADDRKVIKDLFDDLKKQCITPEDYSNNGDTLAKYADLLQKQTAHVIELIKTSKPKKEDSTKFNDSDKDFVYDNIEEPL